MDAQPPPVHLLAPSTEGFSVDDTALFGIGTGFEPLAAYPSSGYLHSGSSRSWAGDPSTFRQPAWPHRNQYRTETPLQPPLTASMYYESQISDLDVDPERIYASIQPQPDPEVHEVGLHEIEDSHEKPHTSILPQPKTKPISQDQLVAEVKGIYAGLVMIEGKCIEVDSAQSRQKHNDLNNEQWTALVTLHRTLLHEHHTSLNTPTDLPLQGTTFNTEVVLNGVNIEANADTGASFNVISKSLADSLNLVPEAGSESFALLPSGRKVFSPGRVKTSFTFAKEKKSYDLTCIILEHSTHALVLGSKVLRLTRTFKQHMHRLKKIVSSATRLNFNLLGDEQEVIPGYLNGSRCLAVPDSGSDIMVLSGSYAKAHGLHVHRGQHHKRPLQFIDGSTGLTDGITKNVRWQFRETEDPIFFDFHIIDDLPVEAILSGAMIERYDVFNAYDDMLLELSSLEDESGIYNIRLLERCRAEITGLEHSFSRDMSADPPFTAAIVEREIARRDLIRDRIEGLSGHERQQRLEQEMRRQALFDEGWEKHRQRRQTNGQARPASPSRPPLPGRSRIPGTSPMPSNGMGGTGSSRFWKGVRRRGSSWWVRLKPGISGGGR